MRRGFVEAYDSNRSTPPLAAAVVVVFQGTRYALMDRDLVHRQTAASAVNHMALGVAGLGSEDALVHLLNYVWPNIFETSPHVIDAVMEAIEGMTVALSAAVMLNCCLQGLFHPARREVYWKIYNSLYIGVQDALVASYPILEDEQCSEQNNIYNRPELMMFCEVTGPDRPPVHMVQRLNRPVQSGFDNHDIDRG
ncbi:hypothetical protein F3Y22_tig00112910pilonHSYRG00077 [Hibiscus syriacus]|uniref:Uncharacterized protein n=1 Tax=Hibiscus syriacus TaxID=106335 RepID=A0A6A2WRS9_HIBSY|nr:hypothetical protein F3Y22_tig00112910pilonHSYRG00077 [Hibiscus syriacus]